MAARARRREAVALRGVLATAEPGRLLMAGKRATNAALTERQSLITGARWCMSCAMYRRADSGTEREVDAGLGRRKKLWKCAVCYARENAK